VRVPYLDNEVIAFANGLRDDQRIRGGQRKWLLREAFGHLLPAEVFSRFKRGFGVPVSRWLRRELHGYYLEQVLSPDARAREYLQVARVEELFREHGRGARDYSGVLWQCLVFEVWLRHLERRFERRVGAPDTQVLARAVAPA
jgi:asparagine synthase (glutamine-hydrolysing)